VSRRAREAPYVDTDLGDQDLSHPLTYAGDGVQSLKRFSKRAHALADLGANAGDGFVQRVDVAQLLGEQEALVRRHSASSYKARLGLAANRQTLCQRGGQLCQQRLSLIQQPPVTIHDLLASSDEHGQSIALRVRLTRLSAFERMREIGVRQEFAGDGLGIDGITLAASGRPPTAFLGSGRADVSHICAGLREGHCQATPQELVLSIAHTAPGACSLAHTQSSPMA